MIVHLNPLYVIGLLLGEELLDCFRIWSVDKPCTLLNSTNIFLTLLGIRSWIPYHFIDLQWNLITWTIQTEFFFYITFPFLLRFIRYLLNTNKISLLLDEPHNKNTMK